MSVFLFRLKNSSFERAQAQDGQPLKLNVKYDALLDTCSAGDMVIVCTETSKSSPACFALSVVHKDVPLRYTATVNKYDPSRKDSHLLKFPNNLEQYKNLTAGHIKVFDSKGELLSADALKNSSIEGSEVTVENPKYSFQVESPRCNLLSNGELVVESDKDDIQTYQKIEDETYVSAIQQLIDQKAEASSSSSLPSTEPTSSPPGSPSDKSEQPTTTTTTSSLNASQTESEPETSPNTALAPPPPPPKTHKKPGKPGKPLPSPRANGHSGEKREHEASSVESRDTKKSKLTPTSPGTPSDITPVDLLMHVTSVAGMLKDLDTDHSERLSRLEEEVNKLKARFMLSSSSSHSILSSPAQSPVISKESPATTPVVRKRGRPAKHSTEEVHTIPEPPAPAPAPVPIIPKAPKQPMDLRRSGGSVEVPALESQRLSLKRVPLRQIRCPDNSVHKMRAHFVPGEFIAVRVDPTSSTDGFWMARVIPGAKQGLVRVKWFEKHSPVAGWYFLDNREDLVDPLSIFHRNFELVVKPWKNKADIFRPLDDLASFDAEK